MELRGQRVLVVGLARSGVAAARFCAERGARVTVTDAKPATALGEALAALHGLEVARELGGHRDETFVAQDLIVLSPGVPLASAPLRAAAAAGVPIWSEVELAFRHLDAPVVAVTGTNGKSTTVSLIADMCSRAGRRTFAGGNLGTPLTAAVGARYDLVVAELSSFQLETVHTFAPRVAVVLNVTPDHLDRYPSMEAYAAAKERLLAFQRTDAHAVLNADDPYVAAMAARARARVSRYSSQRPLEAGAFLDGDTLVLRGAAGEERFDARGRRLLGRHNLENLLVAALCARLLDLPRAAVEATVAGFSGLPHRLELVGERRGVRYYNDSKATNVDSTLRSLESVPGPIRLIAGGRHKGSSYAPLRPLVARHVAAIYTIGEAAPLFAAELGTVTSVIACGDLAAALERAAADARSGDAVLLSPACASYDQFTSYEERGDRFRTLVRELP
jgi:UDP-N-acetylmuramoylalanine--D-glutamate ligase